MGLNFYVTVNYKKQKKSSGAELCWAVLNIKHNDDKKAKIVFAFIVLLLI